jgi:hypothetical protein
MVGLIHKLLFGFIESVSSSEILIEVKLHAGVSTDRIFRMDEAYDDFEWQRLLNSACVVLDLPPAEVEERFGKYFYLDSLNRWPKWFEISKTARDFLERQPRIHNGFATGVRDPAARKVINEKFAIESLDSEIIVRYCSPNRLCGLYKSLAKHIIRHYGDNAVVEETQCLKTGASACELHVLWR